MSIVVAVKIVPDDLDISVRGDRTLDLSKAKPTISTYDLNAIEAASKLAGAMSEKLIAVSVGGTDIDDAKTKKNILSRGVDELVLLADDALTDADAFNTAKALASLISGIGDVSVVVCGDGSADNYAQQVDVQLGNALGWPSLSAVEEAAPEGDMIVVKRVLEHQEEVCELTTPCVIAVTPNFATPRICGMKEILAAGKKPSEVRDAGDLTVEQTIVVDSILAPEETERRLEIFDASVEGDLQKFAAALKSATADGKGC